MTLFKTPREWLAFVTGKKFVRSDTAAIYQFINPLLNNGSNLKVLWKGKTVNATAEFNTMGTPAMKIDDELFALKGVVTGGTASKDIIYTILDEKEVLFKVL